MATAALAVAAVPATPAAGALCPLAAGGSSDYQATLVPLPGDPGPALPTPRGQPALPSPRTSPGC